MTNEGKLILPAVRGGFSRRRFVQGIAAGAAASLLELRSVAWAGGATSRRVSSQPELRGTRFDLDVAPLPVNFTGKAATATVVNGLLPGPILRIREGDTVSMRISNRLADLTSIHWHGILVPSPMDGVPGISFPGIAPGSTFTARFTARQHGTYWYHAHTLAEQTGVYGALIIEPREGDPIPADRDYALVLSDWTDESPLTVFRNLKKMSDYYNYYQPTVVDFFHDVERLGIEGAVARRRSWDRARMSPLDLSDVSGSTYTYLMNGTTPAGNWTGIARPGERVRLRIICAATATLFDVRIPGLKLRIVSTDGQRVEPVEVDEFRIAPGETYDAIVEIPENRAYTIFAQSMDRTGYARGTLAPRVGMEGEVPPLDARQWLEPVDMMGAMATMSAEAGREAARSGMAGMAMRTGHGPGAGGMAMMNGPWKAHHAREEYGPGTAMHVDYPRTNLDDPGVGLRHNGRRELTYADLHTLGGPLDRREPSREIELHLTGNMDRFMWSIDGVKLNDAKPIHFPRGERLRVIMVNDTLMAHPMHLHGMWSEMESPQGAFQARKHTIVVQPAQRVSFQVSADNPGRWAFHCHLLYHMAAGMFREVVVA